MTAPQPGDRVYVVIRSFLYCKPKPGESYIELTDTVTKEEHYSTQLRRQPLILWPVF